MWICLNNAFVSVIAIKDEPENLMVRARKRKHLKALFPKAIIIHTPKADYAFRVIVTRKQMTRLVAKRLKDINYTNFKNSVRDDQLHDLYSDFWTLHYRYQHTTATKRATPTFYGEFK